MIVSLVKLGFTVCCTAAAVAAACAFAGAGEAIAQAKTSNAQSVSRVGRRFIFRSLEGAAEFSPGVGPSGAGMLSEHRSVVKTKARNDWRRLRRARCEVLHT